MSGGPLTVAVNPRRLVSATYDHDAEDYTEEGDIVASYSADRIGMGQPIRRPFTCRGELWVCTALSGSPDGLSAEAYRLVAIEAFEGTPQSYAERTADAESARADPNGFYHGMIVTCRGAEVVLCGPKLRFVADVEREPSLFAALQGRQGRG